MSKGAESPPFGPLLKKLRERHEQSQDELASRLGCKRTYISQLERSLKIPSNALMARLVEAIGLGSQEAAGLAEAAEISRGSLELPMSMPLEVRRQIFRLIQHKDLTSLGSWSALQRELAL